METRRASFNPFSFNEGIQISRLGKKVQVKGADGTFTDSDSVEANLLYEILKTLKAKR